MAGLSIRRIYDPPVEGEGTRILVDRLWPRGIARDKVDLWLKEIAPSDALRRDFHARPERWEAFRAAYAAELEAPPAQAALATLGEKRAGGPVTLLYAAKDETHNNAEALRLWLAGRRSQS